MASRRRPVRGVLVDAGPLIALLEPTDRHHARCVAALKEMTEPLLTVWPAFTEAMYLLRGSDRSQDALWSMVETGGLDFAPLTSDDAPEMRELMRVYGDQPMDLAGAALVAVAEREGLRQIFTLDRRHFDVYRIGKRARFKILPQSSP
jgi:predicted nucleic acid-binding protein